MNPVLALAGNPNTGKTTLFNALTGARAKVANYAGVTVEKRTGTLRLSDDCELKVVDLPGCYSMTARSPDEEIAHLVLTGHYEPEPPDITVVVVDATNMSRNLYFATQIIEYERPVIVALNMMDEVKRLGISIDVEGLSKAMGCPVIPLVARESQGVEQLKNAIREVLNNPHSTDVWTLPEDDAKIVAQAQSLLKEHALPSSQGSALWYLCSDLTTQETVVPALAAKLKELKSQPPNRLDDDLPFHRRVIRQRYVHVDQWVDNYTQQVQSVETRTERIDKILTHPTWGMLIFVLTMFVLFQAVFTWCLPLIDGVEALMGILAEWVSKHLPEGVVSELIVDGVITGIGNILVFLPQILLLFLGISVLEDSGYMARAAVLVDSLMRKVGLHGKAFVPLLSSFACAIPGVMAARTISNRRDRLVTILIAPLMSCSARLPVYTLVIGAVFVGSTPILGIFSLGGLVITGMYFLGLFAALAMARLFKSTILKAPTPPFLMELPNYKMPSAKKVALEVLGRGKVFIVQTGTIILALSIILWALMAYPRHEFTAEQEAAQMSKFTQTMTVEKAEDAFQKYVSGQRLYHSVAGQMGRFIEPVIAPLGFDWKIGIGLIGSFAAREVLVSTLGQVYGIGSDVTEKALQKSLLADIDPATGKPRFTPLVGLSLMVFFVLAMQCLSTVAIVRRETASWRWPIFMIVYMNALAWLAAFATYKVGLMFGMS